MAIAPLFQRFVDDELALAPALVSRVRAGTGQLLGPSNDPAAAAGGEVVHYADIVATLQRSGALYEKAFVESLRSQVTRELDEHRDTWQGEARGNDGLELMDEASVEIDIGISRAMQLIDSTAEWELRELQTFTSTLVGQGHVTAESNPFRPLVYATALWDAACAVAPSQVQRAIILRTSAGVAAGLLKSAAAAASTRLEAQGVEPGVYRTVILPSAAGFARPLAEPARHGALSALLGSVPQSPGAARDEAGAASTRASAPGAVRSDGPTRRSHALEQALVHLDELLRQPVFERTEPGRPSTRQQLALQRSALVASASEPLDRQIIELVSRLFEALLNDSLLQGALRPLISRMQVAALRVCLFDHSALDSFEHPVWRLLDRIGFASQGYSRIEDPRLAAFLAFASAVAEEMAGASTPDTALFRRGLNRIEGFLAEQLQEQVRAAHATVEALELAERREILQQHLMQRLADQMEPLRTSPTIRRFVTGVWSRVIADEMLRHGEQSEQALGALKALDDLLWSLRIPDHPQSRQRLIALLPGLLQRLRVGVEGIALPAAEEKVLFDELMSIHTEALRPGARAAGAPGALSSEEIVKRLREEVIPETPARHFSDSVIDLSSMETVPAEHLPSGSDQIAADPAGRVDALRVGDRQRIFLHGRWSRAQLLWRSDRGLFYLFAGESPWHTHSVTRRALERLAAAGLVQAIEVRPLVERALDRMMRDLPPAA